MKFIRKYYGYLTIIALLAVTAVYTYIPYTYARPASWINPRYLDTEIPQKNDPWLEKQKKLFKDQQEQARSKAKNI